MKLFLFLLATLASRTRGEDTRCDAQTYLDVGYLSEDGSTCSSVTGFSFLPTFLIAPPTTKQLEIMCTNAACRSVIAGLNEAFPTECIMTFDTGIRKTLLDPVAVACAATTTPPSPCHASADHFYAGPDCPPSSNPDDDSTSPNHDRAIGTERTCGLQEVGVDYFGDDIASFQSTLPQECCEKCTATAGCKAYTFVSYNSDGKAYCYLKKGTGQKSNKVGVVSATIVPSPATCSTPAWGGCGNAAAGFSCCPSGFYCQSWDSNYYQCIQSPAKCSQQLPNTDFYGDDLATVYGIGAGECCEKCAATAGCKAYTYVNDNISNNVATPACYLKKGMGVKQPNAHAVSGLVN